MLGTSTQTLLDKLNTVSEMGFLKRDIPDFVLDNLNHKFAIREYQTEAMARMKFYYEDYPDRNLPIHLLFHMATGSGKTLLMASNILYLYEKGYRNFVFFVNSTNIIKKTKANFLDKTSPKYLFANTIKFNDREIYIREVENFEGNGDNDIKILFTTIQGLHQNINTPKENCITYDSFENDKVVFLSDEAHHINTLTKRKKTLSKEEAEEVTSWENTVSKILNSHKQNVMIEYTATVELENEDIREKYKDKIIFQYSLREFRRDLFSKDVQILQSDLSIMDRALQAVILSQYRRKVAEKHRIALKPVVLLKSSKIAESQAFEQAFYTLIKSLSVQDVAKVKSHNKDGVLHDAFSFFSDNGVTNANLVKELKEDFSSEKCVIVNSTDDSEEKQVLLNTLEDASNEIRVVFTTNMLNEGWDVLNLFDIVRLYETRDAKNGKAGKTTISEAQLIGRGARYCPFQVNDEQDKFKRKYDDDVENELRILEELHYHSLNDSRYISEITGELIKQGIKPPDDKMKRLPLKVKQEVESSRFWKEGLIFLNEKVKNENKNVKELKDLLTTKLFKHGIRTGYVKETGVFDNKEKNQEMEVLKVIKINLGDIESHILRKALDRVDFYKFDNLQTYLPNLKSSKDFIVKNEYLAGIEVEVSGKESDLKNLSNRTKYDIGVSVLKEIAGMVQANTPEFVGSKQFTAYKISNRVESKVMEMVIDGEKGVAMSETRNPALYLDTKEEEWYVHEENYGTSEEKYFVRFIKNLIDELQHKYKDVYLLRNEGYCKIYRFSDGSAIEPDFLLFMKEKGGKKTLSYQLFVEPKGKHLIEKDQWKEDFLKEIEGEFRIDTLLEDGKYKLIGLPFYNEEVKKGEFEEVFREKVFS
jgi:type III restriction enzyme